MISLYRVKGHSMEPAINSGDIFLVIGGEAKVNDAVVFEENGMSLVKRVKKIENGNYALAGDNEGHSKEYQIEKEQIIGKLAVKLWPVF